MPVSACKNAKTLALSRELPGSRDHEMQYLWMPKAASAQFGKVAGDVVDQAFLAAMLHRLPRLRLR